MSQNKEVFQVIYGNYNIHIDVVFCKCDSQLQISEKNRDFYTNLFI